MAAQNNDVSIEEELLGIGTRRLERSSQRFIGSALRAGVSIINIPINFLPDGPRDVVVATERRVVSVTASLARSLASGLEEAVPKKE
jgi:hypothetical protein